MSWKLHTSDRTFLCPIEKKYDLAWISQVRPQKAGFFSSKNNTVKEYQMVQLSFFPPFSWLWPPSGVDKLKLHQFFKQLRLKPRLLHSGTVNWVYENWAWTPSTTGTYSVMGQLQSNLDKGIWTGAALLNQPLSKLIERDYVAVHVICQSPGHCQWALNEPLALQDETKLGVLFG